MQTYLLWSKQSIRLVNEADLRGVSRCQAALSAQARAMLGAVVAVLLYSVALFRRICSSVPKSTAVAAIFKIVSEGSFAVHDTARLSGPKKTEQSARQRDRPSWCLLV